MVARVILWIIEFYVVVLLLRAVLSWFPLSPGSPLQTVNRTLERVADKVFLVTPSNVKVSAEERQRLQQNGLMRS